MYLVIGYLLFCIFPDFIFWWMVMSLVIFLANEGCFRVIRYLCFFFFLAEEIFSRVIEFTRVSRSMFTMSYYRGMSLLAHILMRMIFLFFVPVPRKILDVYYAFCIFMLRLMVKSWILIRVSCSHVLWLLNANLC